MKKVYFLFNASDEFFFRDLLDKYLPGVSVEVGESFPVAVEQYDLIVPWAYRKIIKNIPAENNRVIVFHSSELPEGKGWAPIYNAITKKLPFYTISGILASQEVDGGDIVVQARFPMRSDYVASLIRHWDLEISLNLARLILEKFQGVPIRGKKQSGAGSFYPRRRPEDNRVEFDARLSDIFDHLRGCEKHSPAFFLMNGAKFRLSLEPMDPPLFPTGVEIRFYDDERWMPWEICR